MKKAAYVPSVVLEVAISQVSRHAGYVVPFEADLQRLVDSIFIFSMYYSRTYFDMYCTCVTLLTQLLYAMYSNSA